MSGEHSILPPSSASRWVFCNGSVQLIATLPPEEDTIEAKEGIAAHEVGANLLRFGWLMNVGDRCTNGMFVTQEMVDMALELAEHITDRLPQDQWMKRLHIEERVAIPRIHEQCWGTPDVHILLKPEEAAEKDGFWHLHLWDEKFGHMFVEHEENWQCIAYVLGVLSLLESWLPDTQIIVHIHIVQPRAFHRAGTIRTWTVPASDLRAHCNILHDAAHRALHGPALLQTSDECIHCPARGVCGPAQANAYKYAQISREISPNPLTTVQAATELKWLLEGESALKARISALEVQVEEAMRRGEFVPHWQMEEQAGRLQWTATHEEIAALGALNGVDLFNRPEPITPRQAETRYKRLASMMGSYASRGPGRVKLVPFDNSKTKEIFSHGK